VLQQQIQELSNEIVEKPHFELQSFVNTLSSNNIAANKFEQLVQLINSNVVVNDYEELKALVDILASDAAMSTAKFTQLESIVSHLTRNEQLQYQEMRNLMEQQRVVSIKKIMCKAG
jgi:hypothetical protein